MSKSILIPQSLYTKGESHAYLYQSGPCARRPAGPRRGQSRTQYHGSRCQCAHRAELLHRARALRPLDEDGAEPQPARRGTRLPECHSARQQLAGRCLPLDPRQCRRRPRLRDVCIQRVFMGPRPRDHRAEVSAPGRQPPRQELPRPRRQGQPRLHRAEAHRHARHPRRDRLPRQR